MKKLFVLMLAVSAIFFQGCDGPPGPQGPPGDDGVNIVSEVLEVEVDFNEGNNYEAFFELDPPIFEDDIVLTYLEWEMDGDRSIWRLLPQTIYLEQGVLQYNFDFTFEDFRIFLDGPIDFSTLASEWTQNQYFRVVIVPGEFVNARIDFNDYEAVMKLIGKSEEDVRRISVK